MVNFSTNAFRVHGVHLVLVGMVALLIFDKTLAPAKGRWFSIHAFANLLVTLTSIPGVVASLYDPLHCMDSRIWAEGGDFDFFAPASIWPIALIMAVHIYHMVAFNDLSKADYFHHLLFIPLIGAPGHCYEWGAARNFLAFFISGFPGGMDYFFLVLVKNGFMTKLKQKKICSDINIWCRCPGIIVAGRWPPPSCVRSYRSPSLQRSRALAYLPICPGLFPPWYV